MLTYADACRAGDFEARDCALLLNTYAQLSLADAAMFTHIAGALLRMPPHAHTLQSTAMALHALASLGRGALPAPLLGEVCWRMLTYAGVC